MREDIKELTLLLLYLTSWEEGHADDKFRRSWKNNDFDALDELTDAGFLHDSRRSKSVVLTEEGVQHAKELMKKYSIDQ